MTQASSHILVPNQLCRYCKEFVRKHDNFDFFRAPDEASFDVWFGYDKEIEHYPSVQALMHSAHEQCHLCSIFAPQLFHNGDLVNGAAVSENKPLYTHVRSSTFVCNDYGDDDPQSRQMEVELWAKGAETFLACATINPYAGSDMKFPEDAGDAKRSTYTGDGAHVSLIRNWLNQCLSTHETCNDGRYQHFRPTRVLDLQVDSSKDVRLVPGEQCGHAPYVTLSYCWGLTQTTTTTPETLEDFKERIPFHQLPTTMRDAVEICRSLSIRYLWIDALCIIQGPAGDFPTEASRMQAVYAGSLFTICAADVADSDGGCLFRRLPLAHFDCALASNNAHGTTYVFCSGMSLCPSSTHRIPAFPLDTRGWVFQERLLSPRSVHFTRRGVHFECRSGAGCEKHLDLDLAGAAPSRGCRKPLYPELKALAGQLDDVEGGGPEHALLRFRQQWNRIVQDYSRTALSFARDKLAAVAGVAAMICDEQRHRMDASFGLWLRFLPDQLLWRADHAYMGGDVAPAALGLAPSWSWANFDGAVVFERTLHAGEEEACGHDGDREVLLGAWAAAVVALPPVTAFEAAPPEPGMVLRTRAFGVVVRAPLAECWCDGEAWAAPFLVPIPERENASANVMHEAFRPDVAVEDGCRLFCLLVRREHRSLSGEEGLRERLEEFALVLTPADVGGGDVYRRVGLIKYFLDSRSDDWTRILSPEDGKPRSLMYMFTPETLEREVTII